MNIQASARRATRNPAIEHAAALSPIHIELAVLLVICIALAAGAFLTFPAYDDGWLALIVRESGRRALAQYMGDRPVFGFLLERFASFGVANRVVFVVFNAISWLGLSIESGLLFRELFPELRNYFVLPASLTLAPIVLQTQLSTVLVALPANLATILGYAALLLLLHQNRRDKTPRLWLVIAAGLAASGVLLSEYGVATNLVGCVILVGSALTSATRSASRRLLFWAGGLFVVTGTAYLLFAKTADFSARSDVAPSYLAGREAAKWIRVPFDVMSGAWHAVVGAYATTLGDITLEWASKSTIIGLLLGSVLAIVLSLSIQRQKAGTPIESTSERLHLRLAVLLAAIVVGLIPFSIMGRISTLLEFGSRFRIPIVPAATCVTVALALGLVRRRLRWVPVAAFGFIIGYASWTFVYEAVQQSRAIGAVENALKPYVAQTAGYTVAVVPFNRFETELTAKIASTWPLELEKRLWVVGSDAALTTFGDRNTCRPNAELRVQVRGFTRAGKLGELLWVNAPSGKPATIETYCQAAN